MSTQSSKEEIFDEIAQEYLERKRCGESPSASEYCRKFPNLSDEIRKFLRTLELVEGLPAPSETPTDEDRRHPAPERIGDYRIVSEIGRGGMGVVYEAYQESLHRRVAVKVMSRRWFHDQTSLLRFQHEARAAARLHHTNIVPVFEVGEEEGHLFYAMQLINGRSLDALVQEMKQSSDESGHGSTGFSSPSGAGPAGSGSSWRAHFQSIARIGLQAADAIEYAHARGIVHRDVKPSNLMLDESRIVWVTDFGLAKIDDADLTQTGDCLGTLRYMSPERFRGECDVRGDVYALGLTLYELMTLRPAYETADRLALIDQIKNSQPPPPRSLDARIPRDLETIVLKAIDKDPQRRYDSAREIADDLRRFIEDRPIKARRTSVLEQFVRLCRRNKGLAASIGAICLLLVVLTVGSIYAAFYFRSQEAQQRQLTTRARDAEATMQRNLYFAQMFTAGDALSGRAGIAQVRELTNAWQPARAGVDLRGWEWYYLRSLCDREAMSILAHNEFVWSLDWHPQRAIAATSGSDQFVRIWDLNSGKKVQEILCEGQAQSVRWSPDGTRLAIGHGNDITVRNFESQVDILRIRQAHNDLVWRVEWSPDQKQLASAGNDGTIKLWDAATGKQIATFAEPDHRAVFSIAWSPDGTILASGGEREVIQLWDVKTHRRIRQFIRHPSAIRDLCFSPDGRQLAAAGHDRTISVRGVADGHPSFSFLAPSPVTSIAWSPDGRQLVSGNWDGTVRFYDLRARSEIRTLYGHNARVWDVDWSPDGKHVISGALDGVVKLWNLSGFNENLAQYGQPESDRNCAAWGPKNGTLAASSKGDLLVWDSVDHEPRRFLGHEHTLMGIRWSPDGKFIASAAEKESTRIWDVASGKTIEVLSSDVEQPVAVAWGPDGQQLAVANDQFVTIFSAESGREIGRLGGGHDRIFTMDWSPDGEWIAVAGLDAVIRIYAADTREIIASLTGHDAAVQCLRWSPDSRSIASGGYDGTVRIWDRATQRERYVLRGHSRTVHSLAWHPTAHRLASVGGDATLRIWDTEFGAEVVALPGHTDYIRAVDWSPDGVRIVTSSWDQSIRLWDATRGYQHDLNSPK